MNECRDRKSLGVGAKALGILLPGANVPAGSEGSRERKFLELSLPGAKVPGSESSKERKFLELSLPGAKVPGSESSRERKFHTMVLSLPGVKVLRSESSIIRTTSSVATGGANGGSCPPTLARLDHEIVENPSRIFFGGGDP